MPLVVLLENHAPEVVPDAESWQVNEDERLLLLDAGGDVVAEFFSWVGIRHRQAAASR